MGERWKACVSAVALLGALATVPATAAHAAPAATPAPFSARGSVEQVYVTHAVSGQAIELRDDSGTTVQHAVVDDLGSMVFRDVAAGDGYTVVSGGQESTPLHVMSRSETPPQSFYDAQHLQTGFGYITTRDGTKLSATITLPGPADKGPYPTVIEYSGYDPSHPGAPQPSTLIAQLLGYATVGVNVRGSGCSGGTFSFFETLQKLDGYDVVEAVAAQPWVLHGKPGMVGISYPGIAQTFVAPTRPPHLAAIAPLSVVADTYRSLADPGGIPNTGFPREWAQERDDAAKPYGQGWEQAVVDAGGPNGRQCAENQLLRHQNTGLVDLFDTHPFRDPVDLSDELSPQLLAANIDVPVFMGGAWQDEQTGGQSSLIWKNLTRLTGKVQLFGTNGTHVDSLVAELNRWYEFLEFYVARRIPHVPAGIRAIAPAIFQAATGISGVQLEPDRFTQYTDYDAALAAYEAEPPIRILFENGAGDPNNLGAPFGTYELHFPSWPPPNAQPTAWYFQPDQKLSSNPSTVRSGDAREATPYVYDPTAKPRTDFHGSTSDIWAAHPAFDWRPLPLGKALAFDSAPLRVDHGDGRPRQRRPMGPLECTRHRPRGDAHRAAARRPRGVRAERLAARVAPRARCRAFDAARARASGHRGLGRTAPGRSVRESRESRCSRSRTSSAPARVCASRSRRRAGTGRSGRSATCPPTAPSSTRSPTRSDARPGSCCRSSRTRPPVSRPRCRPAAHSAENHAARCWGTAPPPQSAPRRPVTTRS